MAEASPPATSSWIGHSFVQRINTIFSRYSEKRKSLGLSNPGTVENLSKEVQRDVFLNNSMFTGLRADITQPFSVTPLFQTSWAFAMGSQNLPPWTFVSLFGTPKIFMQGTYDNDGSLNARANYRWTEALTTKTQTLFSPGQSMVQIDHEYTGNDFSASIKSINPSLLDGGLTGIFVGQYLQSITRGLALGVEAIWQRQTVSGGPESMMHYFARYKGSDWIASAQMAQGALSTAYWRKLAEKVEVGAELTAQLSSAVSSRGGLMGGALRREAVATVGAKYDFRQATFRAQIDSTGKMSTLLEKRVLPFAQFSLAGELDHSKQSAKVGVGFTIEVPNEDLNEQQEKAQSLNLPQPPY